MRVPLIAAAAALLAGPALAAETVAHAEAAYSAARWTFDWGSGSGDYDARNVALGGGVATTLANGWGVQGDARIDQYKWADQDDTDQQGYAAVHVFKSIGPVRVGAFAGAIDFYGERGAIAGAEAQGRVGRALVTASVGHARFSEWSEHHAWDAQGAARIYLSNSLALDAEAGAAWRGGSSDGQSWNIGLGGEWKPAGSPAGVYANWRRDDFSGGMDYVEHTFTVGLRFTFQADGLADRDRRGASLTGAKALADHYLH